MKTRNLLPFVLLMTVPALNSFSQTIQANLNTERKAGATEVKMNSELFLLGTLNDYISRKRNTTEVNQFDSYHEGEKPLVNFIDSILKKDFNTALNKKYGIYFSEIMSKKMNAYYDGDHLIDSLLYSSTENKLSFLLGVYFRNGEKINDNIYRIHLANSPKHANCYEILKQLSCNNIYYKRIDNIPVSHILYFEATPQIKQFFAAINLEKDKLLQSSLTSADARLAHEKYLKRENDKVDLLFRLPY
ncbi:hypothetical protein [Pedobacter metabolipauper]|uniref:DUF4919 domain-containing protein n=1 Tax=Pedobacter metabolipauper TaxID=425513 RepID=A0A4R6SW54_9SPHI|nr:hypothetical protein [Pedobacter metabolipauper]TDQ08649.1 hypothetical protein ATK78_3165 [Pedobacter metabolipauper]